MNHHPDEVHAAVAVLVAHGVDGATFEALIRRTQQAADEARPHDDEPTPAFEDRGGQVHLNGTDAW